MTDKKSLLTPERLDALVYLAEGGVPIGRGTPVSCGMCRELRRLGLARQRSLGGWRIGGLTDAGRRALGMIVVTDLVAAGRKGHA